jgi:hypothetical protein
MKKLYFLFLSFLMFTVHSQAQVASNDKDQLIQKCLSFQPLVNKIPAEVQAMMADYYILGNNLGADFSQNLIVNGKKISFLTKADLSPSKPFFIFFTINVDNDKAFARYYFTYTSNGVETIIPVTIDFVKLNSVWQVIKYTI